MQQGPTWKELLAGGEPLLLPCAHDALSARLIERAGFRAYSIGGYALVGARHALPDIGLVAYGEMSAGVRDIMAGSRLPVLIDGDDGYGDVKNVVHTVAGYEAMGASAIFIEDQRAPKRCGHMAGKSVIETEAMARKLRAAVAARRSTDLFIIARTDARAVFGLDEALRRGEVYLNAERTASSSKRRSRWRSSRASDKASRACRNSRNTPAGEAVRPSCCGPSWRGPAPPWSRTAPPPHFRRGACRWKRCSPSRGKAAGERRANVSPRAVQEITGLRSGARSSSVSI